ncbi:pyridoxamine 5'-phosphate oxidase family protein [Pseudovibrio sp. SPO723]|uniref:pyridoxamine 5'-phosphate oxidase family protein n=1 Tax=Nesiotobacter zosterae TaxID=392721 RepID=UPI0029C5C8E9|nr:pyridoxamine 5'-phosphate oxidase family protein [Pseudovibrio sp. SPO723]MDX5593886.1 pyridoxamine 5'-phosphate oxidase family protein [Pseudovibrio sp. SPO723]
MSHIIRSIDALENIYGHPQLASTAKVSDRITPKYRDLIEASSFCAVATVGPEGMDCSPRGDEGACLIVEDEKTLLLPDRRGNNRIDSLRNIVRDPRVALMMLIPGSGTTVRVNGTAELTTDPELLARFAKEGNAPRCVVRITINELYFQCARAVIRAGLWNMETHVDPKTLPTPGSILQEMSQREIDGKKYDREWPERAAKTMW